MTQTTGLLAELTRARNRGDLKLAAALSARLAAEAPPDHDPATAYWAWLVDQITSPRKPPQAPSTT